MAADLKQPETTLYRSSRIMTWLVESGRREGNRPIVELGEKAGYSAQQLVSLRVALFPALVPAQLLLVVY